MAHASTMNRFDPSPDEAAALKRSISRRYGGPLAALGVGVLMVVITLFSWSREPTDSRVLLKDLFLPGGIMIALFAGICVLGAVLYIVKQIRIARLLHSFTGH